MCAEPARVNWVVGHQRFETGDALLEDISTAGACVQMDEAIPVGSSIRVAFRGEWFDGKVRYCIAREFGYFIGVKFAVETPWSREKALPAHLINPEAITLSMTPVLR